LYEIGDMSPDNALFARFEPLFIRKARSVPHAWGTSSPEDRHAKTTQVHGTRIARFDFDVVLDQSFELSKTGR
jgi:hypothetical protein